MEKIIIDNVLDAIHYVLKRNDFNFSDKQLVRADEYIIPFINDIKIDSKEFNVKVVGAPKLVHDKRITPLIIKYYAYLEDNLTLHEELMEDNYLLYEGYRIKFYALDRVITSNFKMNEYKNLLLKYESVLSSFYYSLRGLDIPEKIKISKDFSDIVHTDHTTLSVGFNDAELSHYNFLTSNNILLFGKEFLLKISKEQRNMINKIQFNLREEHALIIKELFTKYPDFRCDFPLSSNLLELFNIDEINSMSIKDYILYELGLNNNVFDRIKEILKKDPEFDCPKDFIKESIFRVLSNDEIINLSDGAKEKISLVEIPKIDNVLVMPFHKINRIMLMDKANRKIDSIKNGHAK